MGVGGAWVVRGRCVGGMSEYSPPKASSLNFSGRSTFSWAAVFAIPSENISFALSQFACSLGPSKVERTAAPTRTNTSHAAY